MNARTSMCQHYLILKYICSQEKRFPVELTQISFLDTTCTVDTACAICRLNEVLTKISTGGEKFDMKRLTDLIHKKVLELASNVRL